MMTTMSDRFFGDDHTRDPVIRLGRLIGTILGLTLYPMFVWIVVDSVLRGV